MMISGHDYAALIPANNFVKLVAFCAGVGVTCLFALTLYAVFVIARVMGAL